MYLSIFILFCYEMDISIDVPEYQVLKDIYKDLNEEEDIRLGAIREEHWRGVAGKGDNKKKIHVLSWEVYAK